MDLVGNLGAPLSHSRDVHNCYEDMGDGLTGEGGADSRMREHGWIEEVRSSYPYPGQP